MSVNYLIADTSFQVNLPYDPYLKYYLFITNKVESPGRLELNTGEFDMHADGYSGTENIVEWYKDQTDRLAMRIIDPIKKNIAGLMVFSEDYRSATLYSQFGRHNRIDFIDSFMFSYFQVNLLFTPGIVLHAAAINWSNQAVLFSAQSETGKSTQARLWCEQENAELFNGDRPAITLRENVFYAHGTPWTGSDPVVKNISRPIKAIVMLEQSSDNLVERISPQDAINLFLPRVMMPYFDEKLTIKALDIVDQIIQKVPIYKLKCRPDVGAMEVLKKELSLLPE